MPARLTGRTFVVGSDFQGRISEGTFVADGDLALVRNVARTFVVGGEVRSWPSIVERIESYPDDFEGDWTGYPQDPVEFFTGLGRETVNIQGVTNDGAYWYITNNLMLMQVAVETDLAQDFIGRLRRHEGEAFRSPMGILWRWIPEEGLADEGYDHFGDLSHYQGRLYVPLEVTGSTRLAVVAVFDAATQERIAHVQLAGKHRAAWCAVNPVTGLLYCGTRDLETGENEVTVYSPTLDVETGTLRLNELGQLTALDEDGELVDWKGTAGAEFSPHGHLYVSRHYDPNRLRDPERSVLGIDVDQLQAEVRLRLAGPGDDEIEGLTLGDFSDSRAPGVRGQIHVMEALHDQFSRNNVTFHHWELPARQRGLL